MGIFNKDAKTPEKKAPQARTQKLKLPAKSMTFKPCLQELEEYTTTKLLQEERPKDLGRRIIDLLSYNNHAFYSWIMAGGEAYSALARDKNLARPLFYKLAKSELNFTGMRSVTIKNLSFRDPDAFNIEYSNDMQARWIRGAKNQNEIRQALVNEGVTAFIIPAVHECKAFPFFIVMQYVAAKPLMQWTQTRETKDVMFFFLDLLAAVNFLHSHGNANAGVIHRDLKPENIMVTDEGRPVLTDWGLAKIKGDDSLSQVGHGRGTLRFSSLDQLNNAVDASYHNDAYSLGLIMSSIINKKIPIIENETDLTVASLRLPYVAAHRAPLPPDLYQIFDQATNTDIKKRYMTLEPFYNDVQNTMVKWGWIEKTGTKDIYAQYYDEEETGAEVENEGLQDAKTAILPAEKNNKIPFVCCKCDICSVYKICEKRILAQQASR